MARNKNSKSKSQKQKQQKMPKPRRGIGVLADPRVAKWDALLRDPCGAELAHPCYSGTDNGYLIRTVDTVTVNVTGTFTVGQTSTLDAVFQYSPGETTSGYGYKYWYGVRGGTGTMNHSAPDIGMLSLSTVAEQYRPVAACLRWVPNGKYSDRAGTVGMVYSPSKVFQDGDSVSNAALRQCLRVASNGSESHEIRWLPGAGDENWCSWSSTVVPAGPASMALVLAGVDATAATTTVMSMNGYIETVTVWEWTPALATRATAAPRAPLPYTTQQVLATIRDMGAYLFHGVRTAAGNGTVRAAAMEGVRYLTAGYGGGRTRPMGITAY